VPGNIITLTTDFGLRDPHVAAMKGVMLGISPQAALVDVSHEIPPASIREAVQIIDFIVPCFPKGTVHVAVVDPGVGGDRRAVLVVAGGHFFVGPDNGIFWRQIEGDKECSVIHLTNERLFRTPVSRTFHGRDIFAPVAAHLVAGTDPMEMGERIHDPVELAIKKPFIEKERIIGEITRVDRFGNLITNVTEEILTGFLQGNASLIQVGNLKIQGMQSCYEDVPEGAPLALLGSGGCLEISVNRGRAVELLGGRRDTPVGIEVTIEKR
jgi:S-adenosylmethionine hydrolase